MGEVKVLDISIKETSALLGKLGAKKVFDSIRTVKHLDYKDKRLSKHKEMLKLTEEGTHKVTWEKGREEIKFNINNPKAFIMWMAKMGLRPITSVKARRVSYEWKGIDFDMDVFPNIPPFLEIDRGKSKVSLKEILKKLNLENNEVLEISTPDIYKKYHKDYFSLFKIK